MPRDPFGSVQGQRPGDVAYLSRSGIWVVLHNPTAASFLSNAGGNAAVPAWTTLAASGIDHGGLAGLTDDDHTQYAFLNGRATGQTLIGGQDSGDDLTLQATDDLTEGEIILLSNSAGATGVQLSANQNTASIANNDKPLLLRVRSGTITGFFDYGQQYWQIEDISAGAEDSRVGWGVRRAGALEDMVLSGINGVLQPGADAAYDLGATATRWKDAYFSGTVKDDIHNAVTGYRVNNAAASGQFIRGNGTNGVFSTIAGTDVAATYSSYTPTVTQSGTVTSFSTTIARSIQIGKMLHVHVYLVVNNAGGATAANNITVTLPVNGANISQFEVIGTGHIYDNSAGLRYPANLSFNTAGTVIFTSTRTTVNGFLGTDDFTAALATSDIISFTVVYEVA